MKYLETETVELKKILNKDFAKEVVAFLNTRDGIIYVGIDEKGNICGVDDVDEMMRKIRNILRDQILPSTEGLCEIGSINEEGKNIVSIKVKKGNKLYYIKKEGRSATGCYYRDGTSSTPMSEEEIERRFVDTYIKEPLMIEIPSKQKDFSFMQLKIYYSEKGYHLNDETLKSNLHLMTNEGVFNYLAELLSDSNRISIKIAKFKGKDKSMLIEKSEYGYLCLLVAIDRVINRLESENVTTSIIVGAKRIDKRLMDMKSLREIFINAIAHNDWSIAEPMVYIFSNRIEIISYGGLPKGETEEMFFKGISKPRNNELMRVLSDLDYVEQTGYGIPKVLKHYKKEIFDINSNYVRVSIPFDKKVLNSENYQIDLIENEIINNPFITRDELATNLSKSKATITRIIKSSGVFRFVGSPKNGRWKIVKKVKKAKNK